MIGNIRGTGCSLPRNHCTSLRDTLTDVEAVAGDLRAVPLADPKLRARGNALGGQVWEIVAERVEDREWQVGAGNIGPGNKTLSVWVCGRRGGAETANVFGGWFGLTHGVGGGGGPCGRAGRPGGGRLERNLPTQ